MIHQYVIDVMKTLGYPIDHRGLCFGITSMARQAMLVGDLKTFDERIKRIEQLCNTGIVQNLPERFNRLDPEIQIDLRAFFDGVALYQALSAFSDILQKPYDQHKRESAQFVTPNALESDPPVIVKSSCFAFKNFELEIWLESLKETLTSNYVIELNSSDHALAISYDNEIKQWIFADSNSLPSKTFSSTQMLSQRIHQAFQVYEMTVYVKQSSLNT